MLVPLGAAAGPVAITDRDGGLSAPSIAPLAIESAAPPASPSAELAVRAARAFYGAALT